MSAELNNNSFCENFQTAITDNFNLLIANAGLETVYTYDQIQPLLESLMPKISVPKSKEAGQGYEPSKKRFKKFLSSNTKFLRDSFVFDLDQNKSDKFMELFDDGPNDNWNVFHVIVVSYLSILKHNEKLNPQTGVKEINYRGMIDKLMTTIEEYGAESESDNGSECTDDLTNAQDLDPQELLNQLKSQIPSNTEKSKPLINNLLGDIKSMLSNSNDLDSKGIVDISRDLSTKYQDMINKGDVDVGDLLTGVIDLLNNPDAINDQFGDFDGSNLPNPNQLLADMSKDPSLKEAMGMLGNMKGGKGGMPNMSMIGNLMGSMLGGGSAGPDLTAGKTAADLEKEIEQMMAEIAELECETGDAEAETESNLDAGSRPSNNQGSSASA